MKPEKKPEVVELEQYRKAAAARAAREAERAHQPQPKAEGTDRFLGNRPNAGLLLVVVILGLAALYLLPKLSQFF